MGVFDLFSSFLLFFFSSFLSASLHSDKKKFYFILFYINFIHF